MFLCHAAGAAVTNWAGNMKKTTETLLVYKCYYHRMQVGAEDDVFPDDAVEF